MDDNTQLKELFEELEKDTGFQLQEKKEITELCNGVYKEQQIKEKQ